MPFAEFLGDADIETMLDDIGVGIAYRFEETKGLVDITGDKALTGTMSGYSARMTTVVIRSNAILDLEIGEDINVGGEILKIADVNPIEDGALTEITCTDA